MLAAYTPGFATQVIDDTQTITEDFNGQEGSWGGALMITSSGNATIDGSSFTGNTAYGGAAIDSKGILTAENAVFSGNTADYMGGAISVDAGTAVINNSTFEQNNGGSYGGAISSVFNSVNKVEVNNSEFTQNNAELGGAIAAYQTLEVTDSNFKANHTNIADDGGGAIVLGGHGKATIKGTTFEENYANLGGAIATRPRGTNAMGDDDASAANKDGHWMLIEDSTFKNNVADASLVGAENGTEYHYGGKTLMNGDGGAIWHGFEGSTVDGVVHNNEIKGSTFEGNIAKNNGGAIFNEGNLILSDDVFTENTATKFGGAIYNDNKGSLTLSGTNTFTGNTAAEGADIYNAGILNLNDTTTLDGGIAGDGTINVNGTLNIGQAEVKAGTLAFANGSTLGVEFGNDKMGNLKANTITVGENASDTAKLQVVLSKDFLTTDKTEHSLTNDTAVTNGKFAMADVTNALYNVSFDDSTNIVTAQRKSQEEQQEAVEKVGGTANDVAVTAAFTSASDLDNETTNKVADLINTLAQTDTAKLVEVTKAVAPEVAPAKQVVHTAVLNEVFGALQHRMADASTASPAMYALGDAKDYNKANTKHFSVWTQGLLNKSHKEATSDAHAFTGRSTGVAAGADMKVGESGLVGLGYAYTHTNVSSTNRHDRILGDNFFLYGQYRPSAFYVQGSVAYGDSKYEEEKYLPGMKLDADYHVKHYAMQGRVGYDVTEWFSPNMGLRYTRLHQEGYSDGAQNVSADNSNYFTGMLGADFQTEQRLSQHVSLLPHLYTGLSYDFKSDDNNSRVTLPNATGYNVTGERLHRLAFEVGAGVTARLYHSVEMALGYEGSFRRNYNSHTGTLKLRYLF